MLLSSRDIWWWSWYSVQDRSKRICTFSCPYSSTCPLAQRSAARCLIVAQLVDPLIAPRPQASAVRKGGRNRLCCVSPLTQIDCSNRNLPPACTSEFGSSPD